MTQFTRAHEIASWYQSPGPAGIGFAMFASKGTVTPELWDNIEQVEREAAALESTNDVQLYHGDMSELKAELTAMGHAPALSDEDDEDDEPEQPYHEYLYEQTPEGHRDFY